MIIRWLGSQSLLKSGHFRDDRGPGQKEKEVWKCRNPFLNQVIFEMKKKTVEIGSYISVAIPS